MLSWTRAYLMLAVTMVAAVALFVSLPIAWWGKAGGIVLVFIWCANTAATGERLVRLHQLARESAGTRR